MKHPRENTLALFAGRDLGFLETLRVRRHVSRCSRCRDRVASFAEASSAAAAFFSEMPSEVNWNRLAQEMGGNIRVGLDAGKAIEKFDRPAHTRPILFGWNAATAIAGTALLLVTAFWLDLNHESFTHQPFAQESRDHLANSLRGIRTGRIGKIIRAPWSAPNDDVVLEATRASIQVKENGASLSLLHPPSDGVTVSVSMQGSAGARYVDSETGQVTMNRVYYAQQ